MMVAFALNQITDSHYLKEAAEQQSSEAFSIEKPQINKV
jgi:hypothetical protein